MRLSLGTAQFGLDYGITNGVGKISHYGVQAILATAQSNGITHLDTAAAYGTAEEALSQHKHVLSRHSITTKIPSLAGLPCHAAQSAIETHLTTSKARLGDSLSSVLFHDVGDVLRPEGLILWETLETVAANLGITQIGVSLYDSWEIEDTLARISPDIVQLPFNIFDQRLLLDGSLDALAARRCSIEARSVFLQGVILSDARSIPYHLDGLAPSLAALQREAQESGTSALNIALGFVRLTGRIDRAIVGVTHASELQAICDAMRAPVPALPYPNFRVFAPMMLDPRLWPQLLEKKRAS